MPADTALLSIVGPTASGKTGLAVALAEHLPVEILNVDSMQVFRGLDVGTAKPTAAERARVPFHLVDVVDVDAGLDAATFASLADAAIVEIVARGHLPVAAGGTGLYHRALQYGLVEGPARDEAVRARLREQRDAVGVEVMHARLREVDAASAGRVHERDWVRIERALEVFELTGQPLSALQSEHGFRQPRYRTTTLGCFRPREVLHTRIDARLAEMWRTGLLDETRSMLERDLPRDQLPLKALGYQQAARFLTGELEEARALELAQRDTRRFARRQMTWFRRDPGCVWIDPGVLGDACIERLAQRISDWLAGGPDAVLDLAGLPTVDGV